MSTTLQHEHRSFVRGYMLESNPATPEHARELMHHCSQAWHAYKRGEPAVPRELEVNPGGGPANELVPLLLLIGGGWAIWHFVPGVKDLVHSIAHGTTHGAGAAAAATPGAGGSGCVPSGDPKWRNVCDTGSAADNRHLVMVTALHKGPGAGDDVDDGTLKAAAQAIIDTYHRTGQVSLDVSQFPRLAASVGR